MNKESSGQDTKGIDQLVELLRERLLSKDSCTESSVVFVFGAGASIESGLPIWDNPSLKRKLVEFVDKALGDTFVEEASARLAGHLSGPRAAAEEASALLAGHAGGAARTSKKEVLIQRATMEQLCGVAEGFAIGRRKLIEFLLENYGPAKNGVGPQLAYELTAHFVKHRLVDHIVSMNFDEVIDAALDDELGPEGYHLVLPGFLAGEAIADLPHLFKLHGTISNADSLKFSTAKTGQLSAPLINRLSEVVFTSKSKVWIVSFGYSWQDADIVEWVKSHKSDVEGVIVIARDTRAADLLRDELNELEPECEPVTVWSIATDTIVAETPGATVDEVLWGAWRAAEETPPVGATPERVPSAARHLLLSHLFPKAKPGTGQRPTREWPSVYHSYTPEARLEAEIFLTVGKTDLVTTISSLARDSRIDRHWIDCDGDLSVLERIDFLKPNSYLDVTELYLYRDEPSDYPNFFKSQKGRTLGLSGQEIPDLEQATIQVPTVRDGQIHFERIGYLVFLNEYLAKVVEGSSVEVDPGQDLRAKLLFRNAVPVKTLKKLRDKTAGLIADHDWHTLLVIAESGKWISEHRRELHGDRKVLLIEASADGVKDWHRHPVDLPSEFVVKIGLPWWVHNRHLTMALGRDNAFLGGVYFRRRQRTPRISPVIVEPGNPKDCDELAKMFLAYVARFLEEFGRWTGVDEEQYKTQDFLDALQERQITGLVNNQTDGHDWQSRLTRNWEMAQRIDHYLKQSQNPSHTT